MLIMFNTHCHLNLPEFANTFGDVIRSGRESGITHFMIPAIDLPTSKKAIEIADNFVNVFCAVGYHPTIDLEKINLDASMVKLEELLANPKIKAIGEIGLDYYRYTSPASIQKKFFKSQLEVAIKNDKSVIVHNRAADSDIVSIIESVWSEHFEKRLVLHCITPNSTIFDFAKKKNIFIGLDGNLTYDKDKLEFAKNFPLGLIVLETDSPYLTPEPLKSRHIFPNEPKNLVYVTQKLAEIKQLSVDEVIAKTTINAKLLFAI